MISAAPDIDRLDGHLTALDVPIRSGLVDKCWP